MSDLQVPAGTSGPDGQRRLAVVVAAVAAVPPPGINPEPFRRACLADTYDVLADLVDVDCGVVGSVDLADVLWPGDRLIPPAGGWPGLVAAAQGYDELVVVAGDAPDLPGLVVAKVFRALQRAAACIAPTRDGPGWVVLGVRLPLPDWWPTGFDPLTHPDDDPRPALTEHAARRGQVVSAPEWHRMRTPDAVHRLDPGLEGWERTRAVLSGRPLD